MSFLKGLEGNPGDIMRRPDDSPVPPEASAEEGLQKIEDQLYLQCSSVISAAAHFNEIEPGQEEPPEEWVERMGSVEAAKALRVANASWLPKGKAPMAIELCGRVAMGILGAKAKKNEGPRRLTVNLVGMTKPKLKYREIVQEDEEYA